MFDNEPSNRDNDAVLDSYDRDPEAEAEYYQLQREEDALWYELGERAWFPLVYGDPQPLAEYFVRGVREEVTP